jgi:hypothetical protein
MGQVGFAGWVGVALLDRAGLAFPDDLGWLYRMGRGGFAGWAWAGFAGWAGLALPDGPDWFCQLGRAGFVRWSGRSLPDGPDWLCWMDRVALPSVIIESGMKTREKSSHMGSISRSHMM